MRRHFASWDYAASQANSLKALDSLLNCTAQQTFDIVCFPIIDWDFRFQRPQQLMSRAARAGHRVFYIRQEFREHGPPYGIVVKGENLFEVSLRGPDRNVYAESLNDEDVTALLDSLSSLRRDLSLGATATLVQLPFWWPLAEAARRNFAWPMTYDCMDYHGGFSTNRPAMLEEERHLVESADCVVVSSSFLEREVGARARKKAVIRNGCDFDHFAGVSERASGGGPTVGYYGAIADWFDSDLVLDLAIRRPDWKFLLVGSTFSANLGKLRKQPNIAIVGEQPYSELPRWLEEMDVLILPFKRTVLTEATNPVKAYEILAAGKPLVSVPIEEMLALGDVVELASTASEFETAIERVLTAKGADAIQRRREFAREHTWEKRFEVLDDTLRETFPLASLVIVTYGNLELNRICLQSVFTNTEWPQIEVIVVDNASKDGTREYLETSTERYRRLKVILNDENRGFAAANNQGLRIAHGKFLVLLNNDTTVPRGWLSSLIRHLTADKEIGLIGPVTNQIGNEARVEAGYATLTDMLPWSAEYMRSHDNEIFAIPMLAMYCVAMKREVFEKVGLLDERFGVGMFEDDDYSRRVTAEGFTIRCTRDSFVHHAGGASFNKLQSDEYFVLFDRNRALFEEKWGERWQPHEDEVAKASIPRLRGQLREILSNTSSSGTVVISLPGDQRRMEDSAEPHAFVKALSQTGNLVFSDCSGGPDDSFSGFKKVSSSLYLYRGPMGVLEQIERPMLLAMACHWGSISRWTDPRIIYKCTLGQISRFGRGHAHLLQIASVILDTDESLEALDDARVLRRQTGESMSSLAERTLARAVTRPNSSKETR
jgi:GT2 family glycosyltransferase/glycosyltransferase involved in cell wall biosynthesis